MSLRRGRFGGKEARVESVRISGSGDPDTGMRMWRSNSGLGWATRLRGADDVDQNGAASCGHP